MPDPTDTPPARRLSWRRLWPLAVLVIGFVAFFASGLDKYVSFNALAENREFLIDWVDRHQVLAPVVFVAGYIVVVAFSLPGAVFMTLAGGFLLGTAFASTLVVIGATIGATVLFVVAKTSVGDLLHERVQPWLGRMEAGFHKNELSYMFVLRLVPLFPFFVVNIVPAMLGVRLRNFVIATLFGIIPGTVVYASVGAGMGTLLEVGRKPDLGVIFEPDVLLPILGLAALSLIPVLYGRWRARREQAGS